mmetsp:Transcript_67616/g.135791  ORF Transcript_67616/g.135791 Transcript_67616/m.135791 type:complete len:239 (-) Transcript_67616:112-828(-)
MSRSSLVRPKRRPWSRLLIPGEPVEVPRAAGAVLRLTAAVLAPGGGTERPAGAELRVSAPGAAAGAGGLTLARLHAAGPSAAVARLRALMRCAEGTVLSVTGQPLLVVGRLEGAAALPTTQPRSAEAVQGQAASGPQEGPQAPPRQAAQPVPRSEEQYLNWLEDYLKKKGRTPLRKLGGAVHRPRHARPGRLKATLVKHRNRFVVDLQGCVDINHAKRWRWGAQAAVSRRRVDVAREE